MTNTGGTKEEFYKDLRSMITAVPSTDKLFILVDFNARIGIDRELCKRVLGTESIDSCNSNGLMLLGTCAAHGLLITNSLFHLPDQNKTSWVHLHSKHWHFLDYIIVRQMNRHDVRVMKAMCGANCWMDHRLTVSKLNIKIHPSK